MAEVKIAVKDPETARAWLNNVTLVNEDYHQAMREAAETLKSAQDFGEGTMIDELVDFGTTFFTAADKVADAVKEIATTVTTVIDKVAEFSGVVGEAVKVAKGIFGI